MTKVRPGHRLAIPPPEHPCPEHGIRHMRYNFKTKFYTCITPVTSCGYRSK